MKSSTGQTKKKEVALVFRYSSWISDKWALFATLSISRIGNVFIGWLTQGLSKITGRVLHAGLPYSLHFETASHCNLQCPECMAGAGLTQRMQKQMPAPLIAHKLNLHHKNAFYCNLYFQGEPFLNKEIFAITSHAVQKRFYTVIATNGHFLDAINCRKIVEAKLHRIIISLDGPDKESHEAYRLGGDFERVCQGIATLEATRRMLGGKKPYIVVQMLVHKGNENKLKEASTLAKKLGADEVSFKSMQIYSQGGLNRFLPLSGRFNRYPGGEIPPTPKGLVCWRLWSHAVYTSDGLMVPCCFDKIPEYAIGSVEEKAGDLWSTGKMQDFRRKVLQGEIPLCRNCLP